MSFYREYTDALYIHSYIVVDECVKHVCIKTSCLKSVLDEKSRFKSIKFKYLCYIVI